MPVKTTTTTNTKSPLQLNSSSLNKNNLLRSPVNVSPNKLSQPAAPVIQQSQQPSQHKRRVFSPYQLNPNIDHFNKISTNINTISTAKLENSLKSTNDNETNSNQQSRISFYSRMPIKSNVSYKSKLNTANSLLMTYHSNTKTSTHSSISNNEENKKPEQQNSIQIENNCLIINEEKLKQEDSDYGSSTNSTVNSQDPVNSKKEQDELNDDLIMINKSDKPNDEQNNLFTDVDEYDRESNQNVDDYIEDQLISNLKKTLINLDSAGDQIDLNPKLSHLKQQSNTRTNIKDSLGELNQLMIKSSSSLGSILSVPTDDSPHQQRLNSTNNNNNNMNIANQIKQRRTSSNSIQNNTSNLNGTPTSNTPMFKPPSGLPPVENGEVIQIDIETYRLIMQDLQNTKTILYKLANTLREPSNNPMLSSFHSDSVFDSQSEDMQNPMISSFYNHVSQILYNYSKAKRGCREE